MHPACCAPTHPTTPPPLLHTSVAVDLPPGTPSAAAVAAFEASYPYVSTWPPAIIVQHTATLPTICGSVTQNFSTALAGFVAGYPAVVESVSGYWELWGTPVLRPLALDAVSPDNRTLISVCLAKHGSHVHQSS